MNDKPTKYIESIQYSYILLDNDTNIQVCLSKSLCFYLSDLIIAL